MFFGIHSYSPTEQSEILSSETADTRLCATNERDGRSFPRERNMPVACRIADACLIDEKSAIDTLIVPRDVKHKKPSCR